MPRADHLSLSTDTSQIPFIDLALQPIVHNSDRLPFLSFAPPEPSIAVPFLSLVALSEGHVLPQADLERLYDTARAAKVPLGQGQGASDWPLSPLPIDEAAVGGGDLRRALLRLQFECQWAVGGGAAWEEEGKEGETEWSEGRLMLDGDEVEEAVVAAMEVDEAKVEPVAVLDRMSRAADCLSFADAFLARRPLVVMLVSFLAAALAERVHADDPLAQDMESDYLASAAADDPFESETLSNLERPPPLATRLPSAGREDGMADTLSSLARKAQHRALRQTPAEEEHSLFELRDKR